MIDGRKFFDHPMNSMSKTYENIRKIATGKGDDCTTGCLLDHPYFKENYKTIAVELEIQQYFLLLEKQKKLFLNFHRAPSNFCKCS